MNGIDLVVVAAYMTGMVAMGLWAQRRATSQEEFLVAGRSVGPWLYAGTLATIIIGGGATVGGVKLGYQYGIFFGGTALRYAQASFSVVPPLLGDVRDLVHGHGCSKHFAE